LLSEENAFIDDYRICVHKPEENCDCRKPSAKLVQAAAAELGIDLARSAFVGDKLTDVATGKNSGCRYSLLVRTGKGRDEEKLLPRAGAEQPDQIFDDLAAAVDWLLAQN
jgi:histidinol phosphatase-like enzyme